MSKFKKFDSWEYGVLSNGTAIITKYVENDNIDGIVEVPTEIDGYIVTAIYDRVVSDHEKLVVPDSVVPIGKCFRWLLLKN